MESNNLIINNFDDEPIDDLRLKLKKIDNFIIEINFIGNIDTYNSIFFSKKINLIIKSGYNRIIFNCSGLNYVSSTGIGSFVDSLKTVKSQGGDICVMNLQPKVYEVFVLLGFLSFFKFVSSVDEAINVLNPVKQLINIPDPVKNNIFPKEINCITCNKRLIVKSAGKFRCPECKTIIGIDIDGNILV